MGFFGPSREEQARTEAFVKFQGLIQQLCPEWSLTDRPSSDWSVGLHATCLYEQETVDLIIEFTGAIEASGDLHPGMGARFRVQSSSASMTLLDEERNKTDPTFQWLADYVQNSKPFVALRERKLKLKQGLGF